jgi:hypothetical protein
MSQCLHWLARPAATLYVAPDRGIHRTARDGTITRHDQGSSPMGPAAALCIRYMRGSAIRRAGFVRPWRARPAGRFGSSGRGSATSMATNAVTVAR